MCNAAGLALSRAPQAMGPGRRPSPHEAARPIAPAAAPSHALPNYSNSTGSSGIPLWMGFEEDFVAGAPSPYKARQPARAAVRDLVGTGKYGAPRAAPRNDAIRPRQRRPEKARKRSSEQPRIIGSPNAVGRRELRRGGAGTPLNHRMGSSTYLGERPGTSGVPAASHRRARAACGKGLKTPSTGVVQCPAGAPSENQ